MDYPLWNIAIFLAAFFNVFFLVMSSKLLRDDKWQGAMANSLLISAAQFTITFVIAESPSSPLATFISMSIAGSLGCGSSHWFYTRFLWRRKELRTGQ